MTNRTESVALVKPIVEPYHPRRQYGRGDIVRAAFGSPAAIATYTVPMALLSVVCTIVLVAATPSDHLVYANNALQFIDMPTSNLLALVLPLVLLSIAVHAFASGATQLVITARLVSRPLRASDAWLQSARALRRTLPPAALLAFVIAVEIVVVIFAVLLGAPVWLAVGILIVLLAAAYPLVYLFSLAVLRPLPARIAWREMRTVGRTINAAAMLARVPVAIPLVLGVGANAGLRFVEAHTGVSLLTTTLFGLATTVVAVLATVGAIAAVSRLTLEGLSRQDAPQLIELPAVTSTNRSHTMVQWAAALVALALPFAFLAGSITVNPTNVPMTTVVAFELADIDLVTLDAGNGVVANLSYAYGDNSLAVCAQGRCEAARDVVRDGFILAMAPAKTGGVIIARWTIGPDYEDGQDWLLEVSTRTSSQLLSAAREKIADDDGIVLDVSGAHAIDEIGNTETASAVDKGDLYSLLALSVDTSGEFPVIASLNGLANPGVRELSIYRCVDAECTSATKQSLVVEIETSYSAALSLDLAMSADGTAFATMTGFERVDQQYDVHTTTLFTAAATGPVTANQLTSSEPTLDTYDDGWASSQIVLGADGLPAVLYRDEKIGGFELLVCDDAACSSSTSRAVPGPVSDNFVPSMTVDSSGRPLIATYSENGRSVVVLSCVDAACSAFESRVVAEAYSKPTPLNIAMSADGHPIVTMGRWGVEHTIEKIDSATLLVLCQQARCGAE